MRKKDNLSSSNHSFSIWHIYLPIRGSFWRDYLAKHFHQGYFANRKRQQLEVSFTKEIDIDPLILRVRFLNKTGQEEFAKCLEQESMPLI